MAPSTRRRSGQRAAPALFLFHSLLSDRASFDAIVPKLSPSFRVIVPELPGFGASKAVSGGLAEVADRMAEAVKDAAAGGESIVLGNGYGGFVALQMAIRHPDIASRLILADCGAAFSEEGRQAFRNMAAASGPWRPAGSHALSDPGRNTTDDRHDSTRHPAAREARPGGSLPGPHPGAVGRHLAPRRGGLAGPDDLRRGRGGPGSVRAMAGLTAPRPAPGTWALYDVVWRMYFTADKAPDLTLRGCAAWLSVPAPVDAILAPVTS